MQNPHFGSNVKIPKNITKSILQIIWTCSVQKTLKFQKTCENEFYKSFKVVLHKKPLQKTLNIREMMPF